MLRHVLWITTLLSGCDRWTTCDDLSQWSIPVTRPGTSNEGADAHAALGVDGMIVLAISDPFAGAVMFDGQLLQGPHLARVSVDGQITKLAAIPAATSPYASVVHADAAGNVVVMWMGGTSSLVSYNAELQQRWSVVASNGYTPAFDVAPTGQVVLERLDASSPPNPTLAYYEPDGTARWEVPTGDAGFGKLQIADNGDVFAFYGLEPTHRTRYSAADGAIVDELDVAVLPDLTRPDGSFFRVGYNPDGSASALLAGYDPNGIEVWSKKRAVRALVNPVVSSTGDLVMETSYDDLAGPTFSLLVIDGATGTERAEVPMCTYQSVFAANATQYFGLGLIGSPSEGLASFALP